jgi:hypothetical protein
MFLKKSSGRFAQPDFFKNISGGFFVSYILFLRGSLEGNLDIFLYSF